MSVRRVGHSRAAAILDRNVELLDLVGLDLVASRIAAYADVTCAVNSGVVCW